MTGGYFVSFMSGNSTRLGVGLARGAHEAMVAGGLIAAFVLGVVAGATLRRLTRRRPEGMILAFVSLTLAFAAALGGAGFKAPAIVLLALAMGAENTVFAEGGEVRVGLTYMTGALVRLGKGIVVALFGGDRFGWVPFLLLWLGLAAGACLGALAYGAFGAAALWGAAGLMSLLTLVSAAVFPETRGGPAPTPAVATAARRAEP
jgi:uncharacterized membrane protein YoaK (UPF0700 family)